MSDPSDDRFQVRPGAPKNRQPKFINQVIQAANQAGARSLRTASNRPGTRLGRGHVAARFAGQSLAANARRVAIKTRLVNLRRAGPRSVATHLRYIEREGVGREQDNGKAYGPLGDSVDLNAFEERGREDRHQFRLIVSPEDAEQLEDLRTFTRHLMGRMEADLGTRLDWVAVNHWNTDNPHTHVVVRGRDDAGKDLVISRDYIAQGMRQRACELATHWLGPRSEIEMRVSQEREVFQERLTRLDRTLLQHAQAGRIAIAALNSERHCSLLIGRLQQLERMGLAEKAAQGEWTLSAATESTLRSMSERGDILRRMQRAMAGSQRELCLPAPENDDSTIIGRVMAKGMAGESHDRGYLVLDGIDGRAHYVLLDDRVELDRFTQGAIVQTSTVVAIKMADRTVATLAVEGLYSVDQHLAMARAEGRPGADPEALVEAHVRRLEALRRAGLVERVATGLWRVPADLAEKGRAFDKQRMTGPTLELRSHLSIEAQVKALGATWLDRQLIEGAQGISRHGFGAEVHRALNERADFLVAQGLAERLGSNTRLPRHLLRTLRNLEIAAVGKAIAKETGLNHRTVLEDEPVSGVYRRSVQLASGRFAMLDDGLGFSLVPWKPVIESKLGRTLTATVREYGVSWDLGRQSGRSIA